MLISVSCGVGEGPTALAAFDRALHDAGVANFNLLTLSSVIPPGSTISRECPSIAGGAWGDRLYVVMAQQREVEVGRDACAGIGWVQEKDSGKGLFVEHYGPSVKQVETQIRASLQHMQKYRSEHFAPIEMQTAQITCDEHPVCALVVATFGAEPWRITSA